MSRMHPSHRALAAAIAAVAIAVSAASSATPATTPPAATATPVPAKLDINRASKATLAKLRGIGQDNAQKIIDGRPYKSADELLSKKILPKDVYDSISSMIIAH